jgi:hypothetical protein
MPRVTYADRFNTLLSRPLSTRDRQFCLSLQDFYKRKGRLTPGRVRCVKQLEDRYSPEKLAAAAERGGPALKRLNTLLARVEDNAWAAGFVMSLSEQVQGGRELSEKQIATLEKIEREYSDEALAARATWNQDYRKPIPAYDGLTGQQVAIIVAHYYRTTSYFKNMVEQVLGNQDFTPTKKQYDKMTGNKYAQKVIGATLSAPKYQAGSFVTLRTAAPSAARREAGNKPCVVIQSDAAPVRNAARGAKIYKLLPVGAAKPMLIEERYIKVARGL